MSRCGSALLASHVHEFANLEQAGIPSYITGGLGAPLDNSGPEHAFHRFLEIEVTNAGLRVAVVRFDGKPSLADGEMEDRARSARSAREQAVGRDE